MGKSSKDKRDIYYRKAKEEGWRARSAFKLIQIDESFNLFREDVRNVVDLCAAPGSWSQYVSKVVKSGKLISIDLKKIEPIDNSVQIKGDFTDSQIQEEIKKYIIAKVDVVMSDMAVNTTGIKNIDSIQTGELCKEAMFFAKDILNDNGFLIFPIISFSNKKSILSQANKHFDSVELLKRDDWPVPSEMKNHISKLYSMFRLI